MCADTRPPEDVKPLVGGKTVAASGITHVFDTQQGEVTALEEVSFDIRSGEFVSLIGPSGCGKSTLLMLIAGLLMPTRGSISIDGSPVVKPETNLGIVFQNSVLLAWRNALDNVLLQFEMRGISASAYRERAHAMLASVGLEGFEGRFPYELSGGMQQRVSICRALIHDPPLLLMDEPFGALDAITRDQMALDFQQMWADGEKTAILITHSISEAVFLSDRIIVLTPRPGRIDSVVDVDLPRPRHLSLREEPQFVEYLRFLRERFLVHGVLRDIGDETCAAG